MSNRSQIKRITTASKALKFLRERSGLSLRKAASNSGLGAGVIAHLESGRIAIHQRHLDHLLRAYSATEQTYMMFATGEVPMPQKLRTECMEIVEKMTTDQLRTVHPILLSVLKNQ